MPTYQLFLRNPNGTASQLDLCKKALSHLGIVRGCGACTTTRYCYTSTPTLARSTPQANLTEGCLEAVAVDTFRVPDDAKQPRTLSADTFRCVAA